MEIGGRYFDRAELLVSTIREHFLSCCVPACTFSALHLDVEFCIHGSAAPGAVQAFCGLRSPLASVLGGPFDDVHFLREAIGMGSFDGPLSP